MMLLDPDMPLHLIDGPIRQGEVRNLTTTAQIRLAAAIAIRLWRSASGNRK